MTDKKLTGQRLDRIHPEARRNRVANKIASDVEIHRQHHATLIPDESQIRRPPDRPGWLRRHIWFLVFVMAPTFGAVLYFGYLATPIYLSSVQFVVKDAGQGQPTSGVGQMLQSAGFVVSPTDAYSVNAYIASRDALAELEKKLPIREVYNRPEADFIARFPNFYTFYRKSFEYLFWHYARWVTIDFDSTTNITTVNAYAFRADDAKSIAEQILLLSESAVNRMNARARIDSLRAIKDEVEELQQRSTKIQEQVTSFRNQEAILDPNQASTAAMSLSATLESSLVADRALLDQLQKAAPGSPQLPGLEERIKSLQAQVADQKQKNAGSSDSLASKMAPYTALLLKQQFAQQMLQAAVLSLESAEVAVQQKRLYLVRIAQPRLPDWPEYPYRTLDIILIFFTSLVGYGVLRIILSIIREHTAY